MVGWLSDNWRAQGGDSADVLGMAMTSVTGSVALVALCTFLAAVHALPSPASSAAASAAAADDKHEPNTAPLL